MVENDNQQPTPKHTHKNTSKLVHTQPVNHTVYTYTSQISALTSPNALGLKVEFASKAIEGLSHDSRVPLSYDIESTWAICSSSKFPGLSHESWVAFSYDIEFVSAIFWVYSRGIFQFPVDDFFEFCHVVVHNICRLSRARWVSVFRDFSLFWGLLPYLSFWRFTNPSTAHPLLCFLLIFFPDFSSSFLLPLLLSVFFSPSLRLPFTFFCPFTPLSSAPSVRLSLCRFRIGRVFPRALSRASPSSSSPPPSSLSSPPSSPSSSSLLSIPSLLKMAGK